MSDPATMRSIEVLAAEFFPNGRQISFWVMNLRVTLRVMLITSELPTIRKLLRRCTNPNTAMIGPASNAYRDEIDNVEHSSLSRPTMLPESMWE